MILILKGRGIARGFGRGRVLLSPAPISFLSGVDPETGIVIEKGHPLFGREITGRVLVFPHGKGSTVGSYVLYALSRNGHAPAAMINREAEPIIAVGAIISNIPLVDHLEGDLSLIRDGAEVNVDGTTGEVEIMDEQAEGTS